MLRIGALALYVTPSILIMNFKNILKRRFLICILSILCLISEIIFCIFWYSFPPQNINLITSIFPIDLMVIGSIIIHFVLVVISFINIKYNKIFIHIGIIIICLTSFLISNFFGTLTLLIIIILELICIFRKNN